MTKACKRDFTHLNSRKSLEAWNLNLDFKRAMAFSRSKTISLVRSRFSHCEVSTPFEPNLVPRVFVPYCACWLDETSDSRKFRLRSDFDWLSENNAYHRKWPRTSAAKWRKIQQKVRQGNQWRLRPVSVVSAGAVTTIFLRGNIPLTFMGLRPQKNRF